MQVKRYVLIAAAVLQIVFTLCSATSLRINTARSFSSTTKATIPYDSRYNTLPVTIAVRMRTAHNGPTHVSLVNRYVSMSLNGYQIFMASGNVYAWYYASSSVQIPELYVPQVCDNQWHDVVFIANTTGGYLYVDGQFRSMQTWNGAPVVCTTTTPLHFAYYPPSWYSTVDIEHVQLWSESVDHHQIVGGVDMIHWTADASPNLIGFWQLNEAASDLTVIDSSLYGNHGTYSTQIPTIDIKESITDFDRWTGIAPVTRFHLPVEDQLHINTSTLVYTVLSNPTGYSIQRFDGSSMWTTVNTFTQADVDLGAIRLLSPNKRYHARDILLQVTNPDNDTLEITLNTLLHSVHGLPLTRCTNPTAPCPCLPAYNAEVGQCETLVATTTDSLSNDVSFTCTSNNQFCCCCPICG